MDVLPPIVRPPLGFRVQVILNFGFATPVSCPHWAATRLACRCLWRICGMETTNEESACNCETKSRTHLEMSVENSWA